MENRQALKEKAKTAKQTRDNLCCMRDNSERCYCIMGLACEVYRELTGKGHWAEPDTLGTCAFVLEGHEREEPYSYQGSYYSPTMPPNEVINFFGLDSIQVDNLIGLNDTAEGSEGDSKYPLEVLADILITGKWPTDVNLDDSDDDSFDDGDDDESIDP